MHGCNGRWELVPELSFYEEGEPPVQCIYQITVAGTDAHFELSWRTVQDDETRIQFGGTADGVPRDTPVPPGAQASYSIVDSQTLDSRMLINGVEMAYARRSVSDDGQLMSVLQINKAADGRTIRITQVFRKSA